MKFIILSCLLLAAFCQQFHFFHYTDGHMVVDKLHPAKISGPIFIEFLKTMNMTTIAGMHIQGTTETPFALVAKITKFVQNGDKIAIDAECTEAGWGTKFFAANGTVKIEGSWNDIKYHANCLHKQAPHTHWEIHADGKYSKCPTYPPVEAGTRAKTLVGQSVEVFNAAQVINYATIGYPYIRALGNCTAHLHRHKNATDSKPGFLVIGVDGAHCGIVDKEGDKFIHANPVSKKVSETPMAMIKNFFKNGVVYKDYSC